MYCGEERQNPTVKFLSNPKFQIALKKTLEVVFA